MSSTINPSDAEVGAPRPGPRPSPADDRDPWFDNAKMVLVTLVVVGHSWVLLPDHTARHWAYDFLSCGTCRRSS